MSTIETKVIAATAGSGFGAALSAFFLWIVGVFAFGASSSADQVPKALAAVPEPVGALLAILGGHPRGVRRRVRCTTHPPPRPDHPARGRAHDDDRDSCDGAARAHPDLGRTRTRRT